jgi:glycosyltransferase involved in cell wall biosynthesis
MSQPLVSVIVRSFNRVPSLCELIDRLLRQTWSALEIIVVEQSTHVPEAAAVRLRELAADPRVVLLHRRPLGGAAARNVGVEQSRGEVLLFIDDDDLPADEHWVAHHLRALEDPRCLGVSGKHIQTDRPRQRFMRLKAAVTGTLSYEPFLKLSMTYVEHDYRRIPVAAIHGTNASLRRSAWQRFGGWDEDTAIEDEVSFCFRAMRGKQPDEYFAYDPRPTILRNRDVTGGLGKRHMLIGTFFGQYLDHVHRIIGRYHPFRVWLLYPLYLVASYVVAVVNICRHSRQYRTALSRLCAALGLLVLLPLHVGAALVRLVQPADGAGRVQGARTSATERTAAAPPQPDPVMEDRPSGLASL